MKGNTILFVVGGTVVIGAVSYAIKKLLHNTTKNTSDTCDKATHQAEDFNEASSTDSAINIESNLFEQKQRVAQSIYERHNEAGVAFNESINNILNDNNNIYTDKTENSEQLNKISDNLDDLLN